MADEKPFYIRQLPKEAQEWLKDKAYKSFIADGDKEEDAQKKAEDFLDEKVYTAEEFFGKDFLKEVGKGEEPKYEVVNDESIDAIKDNFTPPGAKIGVDNEYIEYSEKPKALTKDHIEKYGEEMLKKLGASDEQIAEAKKEIDTNDNGKIEEDEMADFQKSLDDYAAKNKKGRDDIPVTTRR